MKCCGDKHSTRLSSDQPISLRVSPGWIGSRETFGCHAVNMTMIAGSGKPRVKLAAMLVQSKLTQDRKIELVDGARRPE
jgi:hypothetical protein